MKIHVFCVAFCCPVVFCLLSSCLSCKMDSPIVSIWGGDVASPKLISVIPESEDTLCVEFSLPVSITKVHVRLDTEERCALSEESNAISKEIGPSTIIHIVMAEGPQTGREAVLCGTVADSGGDTLSFAVPFTGYNSRVAQLQIHEVRCVYSKPKVEYIEFLVLTDGNLGGIEISNPGNTASPVWTFPASEVRAGDYLVYHLRSIEENLINETDENLAQGLESAGKDASSPARDFWDIQAKAPLKKTAVILVRERTGGVIMDAILLCESEKTAWPSDDLKSSAEEACAAGAWGPTALVTDAVCSTGSTATRTIGRDASASGKLDTNTANDWQISPTSKASPGKDNHPHEM